MPRPPSVHSTHSWWSDSNSIGATFDLHAASKPLMRLLYHRQARNFIRENTGIPLSNANVDIFLSYLAFKYTSPATKRMVLHHLSERAASEKDAQTLIKSNLVQSDLLAELLNSRDEETSNGARRIIAQLTLHDPTALEIRGINLRELALTRKGRLTEKEGRAEKARSDAIDRNIREDSKRFRKEHKILVLGPSDSGKSTIVKQMQIVHQAGYNERERAEYRTTIYKNVLDCVETLARVVGRVGVESLPEKVWEHAEVLLMTLSAPSGDDAESNAEMETESVESWITAIDSVDVGADPAPFTDAERTVEMDRESVDSGSWITASESVDEGVNQVPFTWTASDGEWNRVRSMHHETSDVLTQTHAVLAPALVDAVWHIWRALAAGCVADGHLTDFYDMDSAGYFLSSIHRIADPAYVPNEEDILHARTQTRAIMETRFLMGDLAIRLFDVGGLRSERKKWIHCFESVTSIIFCAALSDYDQMLKEDRRVNRMRESLYLFESVINSRWFLRTSVILFFTKIDLFKEKLPRIPLERYFPEYSGGNDLQKAVKYLLWKFMQENRARLPVYPHVPLDSVTKATNTTHFRLVYAVVKETIQRNALNNVGLVKVYATVKEKIQRNTLKYTKIL